jgi:hypothetical protein
VGKEDFVELSRKRDAGIVNILKWRKSMHETKQDDV